MKINELMEALPGQVSGFRRGLAKIGLGGNAARAEKQFLDMAANAYEQWTTIVPKIQASGTVDLNNLDSYADTFGNWMSKALKIDQDDPIITKAADKMKADGINKVNKNYLITLISSMIGQHRARGLGIGDKPKLKKQPGITTHVASDGETYKLVKITSTGDLEWHDKDGNRALDAIQDELNGLYA